MAFCIGYCLLNETDMRLVVVFAMAVIKAEFCAEERFGLTREISRNGVQRYSVVPSKSSWQEKYRFLTVQSQVRRLIYKELGLINSHCIHGLVKFPSAKAATIQGVFTEHGYADGRTM
jgi:hypothetical protein